MTESTKGTILVVDDTHASLRLMVDTLEADGFRVRPADSGELALLAAAGDPPDLILLDIQLGGISGFEVLKRLQADESTKDIPVIFVSASQGTESIVQGLNLGAIDYIYKPFKREELIARTRNHVELHQLRTRLKSQAHELQLTCEQLEEEVLARGELETQLRAEREHQEYLATHDSLTGLPNRRSLEHAFGRGLSRVQRGTPATLIYMDVDRFKACNDSQGHAFGDTVLCAVADEIAREVRPEDIVARVGGDEFAALLEGADEQSALEVARRMRDRVRALKTSMNVDLDLSVGIAPVTEASGFEEVLIAADHAMYAEKNERASRAESNTGAKEN